MLRHIQVYLAEKSFVPTISLCTWVTGHDAEELGAASARHWEGSLGQSTEKPSNNRRLHRIDDLQGFMVINIPFLLPTVDPPTHCGGTDACLPRYGSSGLATDPHGNKLAALRQSSGLRWVSLHHLAPRLGSFRDYWWPTISWAMREELTHDLQRHKSGSDKFNLRTMILDAHAHLKPGVRWISW